MFSFSFSLTDCSRLLPGNKDYAIWYFALCDNLPQHRIDSPIRLAAFMSQTAHESGNYRTLVENLNYRADNLIKVWPTRFNSKNAWTYGNQPVAIANRVYADRMGNGGESSGDGWKYRGRGIMQVTGKNNYRACSLYLFGDDRLVATPDLIAEDKNIAVGAAAWFWNANGLNAYADAEDTKGLTRRINGGYNGLADRIAKYNTAKQILGI